MSKFVKVEYDNRYLDHNGVVCIERGLIAFLPLSSVMAWGIARAFDTFMASKNRQGRVTYYHEGEFFDAEGNPFETTSRSEVIKSQPTETPRRYFAQNSKWKFVEVSKDVYLEVAGNGVDGYINNRFAVSEDGLDIQTGNVDLGDLLRGFVAAGLNITL